MSIQLKDPLLAIAKVLLWFLMGVMALAVAACLIAIPIILFNQDRVSIELAEEGLRAASGDVIGALLILLACAAILVGMLFYVFRLLKHIVDTVGEGDPFVPENAARLTRMAWLTLGVQVVTIPLAALGLWLSSAMEEDGTTFTVETISGNGLLLVLILFILARVFREGARMREELEGTV